jgi:hypothetical protein
LAEPAPNAARLATRDLEDVRREARENWLKMRAEQSGKSADVPKDAQMRNAASQASNTPAPDDDYQP